MSSREEESKIGASPMKLALAAVLTVVFVAVLIVQFGGISDAQPAGRKRGQRRDRIRSPQPTSPERPDRSPRDLPITHRTTRAWPILELEQVLEYDPFALPAPFSGHQEAASQQTGQRQADALGEELARRRAEQEQALVKLQEAGVKAIVGGGRRENVALVGSRIVRVGDELDGFRVLAIKSDGLMLQQPPVHQPAAQQPINRTDEVIPAGSTHRSGAWSDPSSGNRRRP